MILLIDLQFCSFSQIDFWGVQNDLIFIYLCLSDKANLGFPYFIVIFTPTPRHIIIEMSKVKDKENLKSNKRKKYRRETPYGCQQIYHENGVTYSKCWKEKDFNPEYSIQQVYHLQLKKWIISFISKQKLKGSSLLNWFTRNVKEILLSLKMMAVINKIIWGSENLSGKGKYIERVVG